jgi:hypothetical protein
MKSLNVKQHIDFAAVNGFYRVPENTHNITVWMKWNIWLHFSKWTGKVRTQIHNFFVRVGSSQGLFSSLNTLRNQHDTQNTYHVKVYFLTFGKPLSMATRLVLFFKFQTALKKSQISARSGVVRLHAVLHNPLHIHILVQGVLESCCNLTRYFEQSFVREYCSQWMWL